MLLQQCLPLAVLKPCQFDNRTKPKVVVATVLTACGIETACKVRNFEDDIKALQQCLLLAVLKLL